MAAGTDIQVYRRFRDVQFPEKDVAHVGVIMLTRVDDGLLDLFPAGLLIVLGNGAADHGGLDKLGPRPDDG